MFKYLKERFNTLRGVSTNGFTHVFIETLGACTNRCFMCPNRSGDQRNRGKMSNETFELIIKKLKEISFSGELHLYAQNEPFLDTKIIDKIYYANKELPDAKIILISNFTALNDKLIDEILKAPIFNFSCSLYALDKENYQKITQKDNFKLSFINQVKFLKKYAMSIPFSYANYIIQTQSAMSDMDFITNYIFNIAPLGFAQEGTCFPLFNTIHKKLKQSRKYFTDCIYTRIRFSENGDISTCPCDKDCLLKIGNIHNVKTNLTEYYNNKLAKQIRKKMIFSGSNTAYCQYCSFRRGNTLLNYLFPIIKKDNTDKYAHKLRKQRNNDEIIKQKLVRFNEIFKDGEEDKWIDALENLRQEFYADRNKNAQIRS